MRKHLASVLVPPLNLELQATNMDKTDIAV